MKPTSIPLEKILALEPVCLRLTVPESYRDQNEHMNMRWYVAIFDRYVLARDLLEEQTAIVCGLVDRQMFSVGHRSSSRKFGNFEIAVKVPQSKGQSLE